MLGSLHNSFLGLRSLLWSTGCRLYQGHGTLPVALNIGWYSSQLVAPILSFHPEAQDYPHGSSQSGAVNLHWSFSKAQCVFKSYHFHFVVWCNSWIGPQRNTSSGSDVHWECSVMPAITKTDGGFVPSFGLLAFDLQVNLLSFTVT